MFVQLFGRIHINISSFTKCKWLWKLFIRERGRASALSTGRPPGRIVVKELFWNENHIFSFSYNILHISPSFALYLCFPIKLTLTKQFAICSQQVYIIFLNILYEVQLYPFKIKCKKHSPPPPLLRKWKRDSLILFWLPSMSYALTRKNSEEIVNYLVFLPKFGYLKTYFCLNLVRVVCQQFSCFFTSKNSVANPKWWFCNTYCVEVSNNYSSKLRVNKLCGMYFGSEVFRLQLCYYVEVIVLGFTAECPHFSFRDNATLNSLKTQITIC